MPKRTELMVHYGMGNELYIIDLTHYIKNSTWSHFIIDDYVLATSWTMRAIFFERSCILGWLSVPLCFRDGHGST